MMHEGPDGPRINGFANRFQIKYGDVCWKAAEWWIQTMQNETVIWHFYTRLTPTDCNTTLHGSAVPSCHSRGCLLLATLTITVIVL